MLADTNYPPPDSSDIPEDRRDAYRKQYQKELRNRTSPVQQGIDSFVGEATLCAELYGELEVEDHFLFNEGTGNRIWAVILTKDAIIQTHASEPNSSGSGSKGSIVMHMLHDIDRLSVWREHSGLVANANLHKARHNEHQGMFWWQVNSENDVENDETDAGSIGSNLG